MSDIEDILSQAERAVVGGKPISPELFSKIEGEISRLRAAATITDAELFVLRKARDFCAAAKDRHDPRHWLDRQVSRGEMVAAIDGLLQRLGGKA
jgi:hypothetical protein